MSTEPKNPVRNPFAQGAQVMATPSNNRHKDVYGGLPRLPRQIVAPPTELEEVPPSSISCVPSSSGKTQRSPFLAPDSIGKTSCSALPIAETPTRGPLKLCGRPPTSVTEMKFRADISQPSPLSAASKIRKTTNNLYTSTHLPLLVHEMPSKFRYSHHAEQPRDTTIDAISVKAPSTADRPRESSTKHIGSPVSQDNEESIYAALGWDDADELL